MIELQIEKQLLNIINKNHIQPYSKLDLQRITEKLEKKNENKIYENNKGNKNKECKEFRYYFENLHKHGKKIKLNRANKFEKKIPNIM